MLPETFSLMSFTLTKPQRTPDFLLTLQVSSCSLKLLKVPFDFPFELLFSQASFYMALILTSFWFILKYNFSNISPCVLFKVIPPWPTLYFPALFSYIVFIIILHTTSLIPLIIVLLFQNNST